MVDGDTDTTTFRRHKTEVRVDGDINDTEQKR